VEAWLLGSLGTVGPTATAGSGPEFAPPLRPPCFEMGRRRGSRTISRHLLAAPIASRIRLNHGPKSASDAADGARIVPLRPGVAAGYPDRCGV
jgi:hypothetical protein